MDNASDNHIALAVPPPEKEIEELRRENAELREKVTYLENMLEKLKRQIFGQKRERYVEDAGQLKIDFEFEDLQPEATPEETETVTYQRRKPKKGQKPVRVALPEDLPRREEVIEPAFIPRGAVKIGENVTEILGYEPGELYVRKIIRPKYSAPNNQEQAAETGSATTIITGELPCLPIPKGNADASILAHIIMGKFVDHLPFYRQRQQFIRQGLTIAESTINGWFTASCNLIWPLYEKHKEHILAARYLQVDETPIPVLTTEKKGSAHKGYFWVYYDPLTKTALFDYRPGRGAEGPGEILRDFKGTLQTDGYVVYDKYENKQDIILLACLAHARRYFFDSQSNDRQRARYVLSEIGKLYDIERHAKDNGLSYSEIFELRQEKAKPVLEALHLWLRDQLEEVLPKSAIGKAIAYTLGQWKRLVRYLDDGMYLIDNNLVENSIRPVALGRKNYLFAGSHQGAQRAAMIYSFTASCKQYSINPFEWLKDVLARIPDHKANKIDQLLPLNWRNNQP